MRSLALALALTCLVAGASAQEAQPQTIRKLIKIQHVDVNDVAVLIGGWIKTFPSRDLGAIIVEGTPDNIAEAEAVVREVDQIRKDSLEIYEGRIEIDAYFIAGGSDPSGDPVPPTLAPVVAELEKRFSYAHYGLLDSSLVLVKARKGAKVDGQFSREGGDPVSYRLYFKSASVDEGDNGRSIFLDKLSADWRIPVTKLVPDKETGQPVPSTTVRQIAIDTDVSIPENKFVVVGKAGSPTSAEAIFLVLRARLVE